MSIADAVIQKTLDNHKQDLSEAMEMSLAQKDGIVSTGRVLFVNGTLWPELVSGGIQGWFSSDFGLNPRTKERILYAQNIERAVELFDTRPQVPVDYGENSGKPSEFIGLMMAEISIIGGTYGNDQEATEVAIFDGYGTWVQLKSKDGSTKFSTNSYQNGRTISASDDASIQGFLKKFKTHPE